VIAIPVAVLLVGSLLTRDRHTPGGARMNGLAAPLLLILCAAAVTVAGAATVPARSTAEPRADAVEVRGVTATNGAPAPTGRAATDDKRASADDTAAAKDDAAAAADDAAAAAGDDSPARSRPASASRADATAFVRDYYQDLNAGRFDAAWSALSPAVRTALGPYARWKDGYGSTLYSRPVELSAQGGAADTTVTHILAARDKGCDERQFRVTWRLKADGDRWTVANLQAVALGSKQC
jgi:hypothetical protein